MGSFNITQKELANALDIKEERLTQICEFFDQDPDDDWDLVEDIHFRWGAYGARLFSPEGAIEICNYLEDNKQERDLFVRFQRWLLRRDTRLKGLMITKKIQEVSFKGGGIVFKEDRAFLSPRASREVLALGTRQDILREVFQTIQKQENTEIEPLKLNVDFFEDPDFAYSKNGEVKKNHYFSGSGIASVSLHLGVRLKQKHRKAWMEAVGHYAPRSLATIEDHEARRANRIKDAMDAVRKKAKKKCQLTGRRQSIHKFDLEVHHLYDKHAYPQFADLEINLFAMGGDVHADFHKWMGGSKVSCTIEDFERYIEEFHSSLFEDNIELATRIAIHLKNAKQQLEAMLKQGYS